MSDKVEVTMWDGRKQTFGKVQKMKKEIILTAAGTPEAIRFDCITGDSETVRMADVPSGVYEQLAAHGLSQKLGDEYADVDSPSDCIETMRQLWQRLLKGNWNAERQGFAGSGILFEACKLAYPDMAAEAIREVLNGMSAKEKAAFKVSDFMKPHVATIEAQRAKGVDTDALKARFTKVA